MKTRNKAFSMVELMIVVVIVAILAAVATPLLRGRLEKAKWSEAMAGCSAIATAIRSYAAENSGVTGVTIANLGFSTDDLDGKYFDIGDYALSGLSYDSSTGELLYTITVTGDGSNGAPTGSLVLSKADGSDHEYTLTQGSGTSTTTSTF